MKQNTELLVFNNEEFGEIRTLKIDNEPWFVGKDVAEKLGYTNPSKALLDHVYEEDKLNNVSLSSLGQRGGWLINESGLYSLILNSKLPTAKKFKHWVTSDVLPSIRKHGMYATIPTVDEMLNNPDYMIKLLTDYKAEKERTKELNYQNTVLNKRNTVLKEDNKALADEILRWEDREQINFAVRKYSKLTHSLQSYVWSELYKQLNYKYHINLRARKKSKGASILSTVKEEEWTCVLQSFAAMCEEKNLPVSRIFHGGIF